MGIKLTYFNYQIIKSHLTVAFSTFYNTHFCRQIVAFKKKVDRLYSYSPLPLASPGSAKY